MSRFVLALDQGTTSSRAIVFARDGRSLASAQQEFPQIFPSPGHVEHDPENSLTALDDRLLAFQEHYQSAAKPLRWRFTWRDLALLLEKIAARSKAA